jgi:UDP-glucose 4-epimerase
MDPDSPYSLVIGKFFKQKQDGKPLTICGDGEYYRDFTYVTDVVQANILAMTSGQAGNGEVINIGRGHAESINTLAKLIGGEIAYVDRRPGDCIKSEADIAKAKQLLQWGPTVSLESGIDKMKKLWGVA